MESMLWGPVKCGIYKQVVFIYRWSLDQILTVVTAALNWGSSYIGT